MVKGVSRRVIVVDSPDPKLFEQAIFIVSEPQGGQGMTQSQLLQEAQRIAGRYAPQGQKPGGSGVPLAFAAGMGVTGLAWIAALLLF